MKTGKQAVCENRHSFDYAKSGYLNLLLNSSGMHGDDKAMVKARTQFLETGAYAFLRDELCTLSRQSEVLADLGCGEGYYTSALPAGEKYGFDLSKDALAHAAKKDPGTYYTVASIFHLPLPGACADTVLTCFAPVADAEIRRILKPGGTFILVTPGPRHLFEMKEILYEHPYENPSEPADTSLELKEQKIIRSCAEISGASLQNLFMMTPYVWKTEKTGMDRLSAAGDITITYEFCIRTYTGDHP